jgi:hypothetical protein
LEEVILTVIGALQHSLYSALTGDATLMAQIKGVYDYVYGVDYPYVVIGDAVENTWDCLGRTTISSSEGYDVEHTIYIVSDSPGFKESLDILVNVERVLNAGITISGYTVILDSLRKTTKRDNINGVRIIPVVVRFLIKKA